ncbi:MAG: hypothetical protein ACRDTC_01325 [Pseudonocardiaceae bacterium]
MHESRLKESPSLFTGRRAVLERILTWIHAELPGAFVVTGAAGSGKSAVVEHIAALAEPARRRALLEHTRLPRGYPDPGIGAIDAAVHLRGMRAHDVATALADRLQLPAPKNCWQLIDAVAELPYPPVLVFDGLDEAIPEQATKIVTDLLVPLSVLASVLVATRFPEFGWNQPSTGQEIAARLGELFGGTVTVVDLDVEPGTLLDIRSYITRRLRAAGRADLVRRVAPTLARRAAAQPGGFLYARTVVSQILRGVIDLQAQRWTGQLPATAVEALERDLSGPIRVRDGVQLPDAARDLLRPLGWAMGRGMPAEVWAAAATALSPGGGEYRPADLAWVREHHACYLLEEEQDGEPVYRLFHREFIEHFLVCSPHVAGRPAAEALVEALVALAGGQNGHGGAAGSCDRYLQHHLPRHATHAGPAGIAALHTLAGTDPESYLPNLAVALDEFTAQMLATGSYGAALVAIQHAVQTYRTLVEVNPEPYLPGLAAALSSLAHQHAERKQHDTALIPAQHAAEIYCRLAEQSPEAYFTHLVIALKNLTCQLAALDRISAAVDVYTGCIEVFAGSPALSDTLIIERAGFHLGHGDGSTGLRELVTLLTLNDGQTPDSVMLAARTALRVQCVRDCAAVHRSWRSVTGSEPPDWLALTSAQIGLVTEWLTAPSWAESRDFFAAHAEELLDPSTTVVLDELRSVAAARVELHRHLLDGVRNSGLEVAYRPLLLRDLLTTWVGLEDWQDSQSFAEEHAADLLTVEAEVALIHLGDPLMTYVHLALLRLARRDGISAAYACVTDRQAAADRMRRALAEVEPDPIAELAALEGQVYGEQFTAAVHLFLAALLMGEAVTDFSRLEQLAEQADPADRQRATAEINDLISRFPDRAEQFGALPQILLSGGMDSLGRKSRPRK